MRFGRIVFGLMAVLGLCFPVCAQSRRIDGGFASTGKFAFYWETHLDPSLPELANVGGGSATDSATGTIHRFMADRGRRVYFGYDVSIQALPEPMTYRVTFTQLSLSPDLARRALLVDDLSTWTQVRTPGWGDPSVRIIRAGEVLSLTLLTNNASGQKIVDYVTVQEPPSRQGFDALHSPLREFGYATGTPHDFRVEDAELRIREPRISINGKFDPSTAAARADTVSGEVVWFYLPMRGRFILSLIPRADLGFRKSGEIRGTTLTFTVGGDTFNVICGGQVAPGPGPFNLYVLHDPSWRPTHPFGDAAFNVGAADSADQLIRK